MSRNHFYTELNKNLEALKTQGLYKDERIITSPQSAQIMANQKNVLNFCANNYLGLANHPQLCREAEASFSEYGYGLASVRFICGTQKIHKDLERELSLFLGTEDTILYSSCFDANGGLFETLLGEEDAIISDELNHASIIDGIRLSKAKRLRYKNNSLDDLRTKLKEAQGARFKLVATDGVFSMDGSIADLAGIVALAREYDALVMVDDSHAVGVLGKHGRGSIEHCGVEKDIDIVTGTLGKALGGASGGYTSGRSEMVAWLRQRSRPYLFSNTLAPVIAKTSLAVLQLLKTEGQQLRKKLSENSQMFRHQLSGHGFKLIGKDHPIIPVMLGDAIIAKRFAEELLSLGIYVISFSYPVVPLNLARIRTQISAAHSPVDLKSAAEAFAHIGKKLGVLK